MALSILNQTHHGFPWSYFQPRQYLDHAEASDLPIAFSNRGTSILTMPRPMGATLDLQWVRILSSRLVNFQWRQLINDLNCLQGDVDDALE